MSMIMINDTGMIKFFPIILIFLTLAGVSLANTNHNVATFGAKPDGETDSSKAFLAAWSSACSTPARATIVVPPGQFMVRTPIIFSGQGCKSGGITFLMKGTIVGPVDFRVLAGSGGSTWVLFRDVNGITISGGVFDGRGAGLWACKRSGKGGCPDGVTTLGFSNSMNIIVNGVTSLNSQLYHIVVNGCKNVKIQGVRVLASGASPNTDGIHVQLSTSVTILNSNIGTGDDCISIGEGTTNLWIEGIACGPGHGISIGSLGKDLNEQGVQNVTVRSATFIGTENGVRIKSWARPSNGFVRNIVFQHLTMVNAQHPIIIDQKYCPDNKGCPKQVSGVRISDITYEDIHGTSATPIAMNFDCSSKYHCTNIKLEGINLTFNKKATSSFCVNAGGSTYGIVQPKSCL
ncbi:hypothetical protein Cgig2_021798 [Carnegiea gigantea]|uniref:Polygalacturonase-like n=1 Tax=Carnegiea gigantea TaxID=171969 RepID=A0A9Q1K9I5_9CARY|nr:hypothetical protein Cgig2_021798 [Carnegiea gigantea]